MWSPLRLVAIVPLFVISFVLVVIATALIIALSLVASMVSGIDENEIDENEIEDEAQSEPAVLREACDIVERAEARSTVP